jgi:hypothetical protein
MTECRATGRLSRSAANHLTALRIQRSVGFVKYLGHGVRQCPPRPSIAVYVTISERSRS